MKKYLVLTVVLISVLFVSGCDFGMGYEAPPMEVLRFEYKSSPEPFNLRLSLRESNVCTFIDLNVPFRSQQYVSAAHNYTYGFIVDSIPEGDILTILCYRYVFSADSEEEHDNYLKYFNANYLEHFTDSVVISGPSPIYEYHLNTDHDINKLLLTEVDSLCP